MADEKPKTGRWMGIDYGDTRIGIAVSDQMGILASGLETIRWNGKDLGWALDRIVTLVQKLEICGLVVGIPRRTDGKIGDSEVKARQLAALLAEQTGLETVLLDERYTTVLAARVLREAGIRGERRKAVVDQVAAEIILREYLESRRHTKP